VVDDQGEGQARDEEKLDPERMYLRRRWAGKNAWKRRLWVRILAETKFWVISELEKA
jgi:hypothetical protein